MKEVKIQQFKGAQWLMVLSHLSVSFVDFSKIPGENRSLGLSHKVVKSRLRLLYGIYNLRNLKGFGDTCLMTFVHVRFGDRG